MVEFARRVRMRVPAAGTAVLLAVGVLAGCGGSGSGRSGSSSSGSDPSSSSSTPTTGSTSTSTAPPPSGSLTVSPAAPTTGSEITFSFAAPVSTGVHGTHEISYSLSVVGPDRGGCVNAHEAGSPAVARGARGEITLGPAELPQPWCTGMYEARLLELSSAHCTGSAPCPQYVRVVGIIGRATYTVRRG